MHLSSESDKVPEYGRLQLVSSRSRTTEQPYETFVLTHESSVFWNFNRSVKYTHKSESLQENKGWSTVVTSTISMEIGLFNIGVLEVLKALAVAFCSAI